MSESSRNVEYRNTLLEPLFSLIQSSAGNPAAERWEALTDEAVETDATARCAEVARALTRLR